MVVAAWLASAGDGAPVAEAGLWIALCYDVAPWILMVLFASINHCLLSDIC